jgi:hypothetical protein
VPRVILAIVASLSLSGAAFAFGFDHDGHGHEGHGHDGHGSGPVAAPEIDPASAFSALTLLAGGLAAIRGRKSKKS